MIKDYSSFRCIKSDTCILKLVMMKHQVVTVMLLFSLLRVHVYDIDRTPPISVTTLQTMKP